MQLPECDRVIYEKNPLVEVVCQLRFPPILRIAQELPAEFQERIRRHFPLYEAQITLPEPLELLSNMNRQQPFSSVTSKFHQFKTQDSTYQLSLSSNYLALSTSEYERYETFRELLKIALDAFQDIYQSPFFERIGLRYRDLVVRTPLGLQAEPWADLIAKHVALELHNPAFNNSLASFTTTLNLELEGLKLTYTHGLIKVQHVEKKTEEDAYLMDADFYKEGQTTYEQTWRILDHSKALAGRLFRWSITDKLHRALEPRPIQAHAV
jgi:uncharacterized protein (TIGR04255 family)